MLLFFSLYHVAANKVRGTSMLTSDYGPGLGFRVFCVVVLLSIMWLRTTCAARRRLRLTMDMAWDACNCRHRTARVKIRLLFIESKSHRLSTVYLQRRTVWVRYRSHSFWNEIAGNGSERESRSTILS